MLLGPAEIFTFLFVMLGPLKLLGPFVQRTRGLDDATVRQIAFWAFLVATAGIVAGGLIGRAVLAKWHVSLPALHITAGIVFFLVALRHVLEPYEPPHVPAPEPLPPTPFAAASRLVFPMVLTPYGIAAVIALLAASTESTRMLTIFGLVLVVMVLNLLAMSFGRRILVGPVVIALQVVGGVLAILQVALSVQIILGALRSLGVLGA
jgi:small neutral amino acid transporter SnatA (MarC family)